MKTIIATIIMLFNVSTHAGELLIVGHRGASRDAPENTLPAFKLAWKQGADAIEGDYHLTKDGHIVCNHDDNTKRVSNVNKIGRDSTLAELRGLDVGSHLGEAFKGTVIPTLAEVASTVPNRKTIYIEIKCGTEIIPALLEEIRKTGLKNEQIAVISFNQSVIQELKAKAPSYKAYWLCSFKKGKGGEMTPSLETVLKTLALIQADGLISNITIPGPFPKAIGQHGYEWPVWTVDDLKTSKAVREQGAKSVTTNIPKAIREHLLGNEERKWRRGGEVLR